MESPPRRSRRQSPAEEPIAATIAARIEAQRLPPKMYIQPCRSFPDCCSDSCPRRLRTSTPASEAAHKSTFNCGRSDQSLFNPDLILLQPRRNGDRITYSYWGGTDQELKNPGQRRGAGSSILRKPSPKPLAPVFQPRPQLCPTEILL